MFWNCFFLNIFTNFFMVGIIMKNYKLMKLGYKKVMNKFFDRLKALESSSSIPSEAENILEEMINGT